jgi:sugar fermentation stimulation protein A
MKLGSSIIPATFAERLNRFTVIAYCDSSRVMCYFPNPGRMKELLKPNAELALNQVSRSSNPARKTLFEVVAVRAGERWISIDSRVPNELVAEALKNRRLAEFQSYNQIKRENVFNRSRFDFLLESPNESCLLEVKSCTLVVDGVGIFPDAPSARGSKHLQDLAGAKRCGYRACVLFVIQRDDAMSFTPNRQTDPDFYSSLRSAIGEGVEVYARRCKFSRFELALDTSVSVKI